MSLPKKAATLIEAPTIRPVQSPLTSKHSQTSTEKACSACMAYSGGVQLGNSRLAFNKASNALCYAPGLNFPSGNSRKQGCEQEVVPKSMQRVTSSEMQRLNPLSQSDQEDETCLVTRLGENVYSFS